MLQPILPRPILKKPLAAALLLLAASFAPGTPVRAGGSDIEQTDDHTDELRIFGEARDIAGMKPLEGVTIKGTIKGQKLPRVSASDVEGRFTLAGFAKDIKPDTIEFVCEKQGYASVDVTTRRMGSKPEDPVAVECLLARE
jgi:hypothetical protein